MATATITMTDFHTALAECADAIEGGDFTTAWKKLAKAEVIQNGLATDAGTGALRTQMRQSLERSRVLLKEAEAAVSRGNSRRLVTTRTNFN